MGHFTVYSVGKTDVGQRRSGNEDSIYTNPELGLHFVADGMGGHAAGEIASGTAVEKIAEFVELFRGDTDLTWPFGFNPNWSRCENMIVSSVKMANQAICDMAREHPEMRGMGTTVASVYVDGDQLVIAHVGDSRVYRFRGDSLVLMTEDHTWVNEQLQREIITEEEAKNHRWKNVITRALGNRSEVEVDVQSAAIENDDLYLLCSDGLTTMLDDEDLRQMIIHSNFKLEELVDDLIHEANSRGGFDNISVILLHCLKPENTPTLVVTDEEDEDEQQAELVEEAIEPTLVVKANPDELEAVESAEEQGEEQ
ncbi:Stp1/IreP family PP2C-type Ser/Thr phosphatase [Candidatus Sumerlaeota bacterium]|nr:Stp1/IreP family PP2C-type Ser/Thr phosphatase [Candidatus Sumerlaeota bacterium]